MKNGRRKQMLTRLKHIKIRKHVKKDGTQVVYYYHRRTGKRIEGEFGSSEFLENYVNASKEIEINENTVHGLIYHFKKSLEFESLAIVTQQDYHNHFNIIGEKWGEVELAVLEDRRIRKDLLEWRDQVGKKSKRQADYVFSTFRRLVNYGIDLGLLNHNHLTRPKRLYKSNSRRDRIWLHNDVEKVLKVASDEMKLAIILALHTGQRRGDLIAMTWTAYDGTHINIIQRKTNAKVYIPVTSTLKSILDNMGKKAITVLTNTKGHPWTEAAFKSAWTRTKKASGIKDLTFHDLRGTAMTVLSENGATSIQIASITGHSLEAVEKILDTYISRTKPLANSAISRFEQSWINKIKL